jgi:hypothetical protein
MIDERSMGWTSKGHTSMNPRIAAVRHLADYRLESTFTDGTRGEVDLRDRVVGRGGALAPLEDVAFFAQVRVDREIGTIVWPNGVDLCPDVLYARATGNPLALPASR